MGFLHHAKRNSLRDGKDPAISLSSRHFFNDAASPTPPVVHFNADRKANEGLVSRCALLQVPEPVKDIRLERRREVSGGETDAEESGSGLDFQDDVGECEKELCAEAERDPTLLPNPESALSGYGSGDTGTL
jgi:hypothetical protein